MPCSWPRRVAGGEAGLDSAGVLCAKITFWPGSEVRSEPSGEAEGFPGGVCGRAVLVAYHVVADAGAGLLAGGVGRGVEVPLGVAACLAGPDPLLQRAERGLEHDHCDLCAGHGCVDVA